MAGSNTPPVGRFVSTLLTASSLSFALSAAVASLFARYAPAPYMDEIFHVPQARSYCQGRWDVWDPKLTTPPGLYLVSVATSRVASLAPALSGRGEQLCLSTTALRSTNLVLFALLQTATYHLLSSSALLGKRRTRLPPGRSLEAVVISFLPPLFFFQFLYYTDMGGAAAVLGMLAASRGENHALAALLGFVSLWFRQTNIIWVAFSLGASLLTILRRRGLYDPPASYSVSAFRTLSSLPLSLFSLTAADVLPLTPYVPVMVSFLAFLRWNGSIVLGDRSNHVATLHGAQPGYLLGFALFFGWPALLGSLGGVSVTLRSILRLLTRTLSLSLLLLGTAVLGLAVHRFTIAHPFLLADNRHYTFYLWRRVVSRTPWSRYALVPVYVGSGALWSVALARTHSLLYLLGLAAASCLTLIPSPLIEPRYFLVPYLIMRAGLAASPEEAEQEALSSQEGKTGSNKATRAAASSQRGRIPWLFLELAWYALINAATIYVFLFRPFPFTDGLGRSSLERFMW